MNFTDLLALAQHYGSAPDALWVNGDFTFDGTVNFQDLLILAQNYGQMQSDAVVAAQAVTPVPEPASMAFPMAAALGFGLCRKRRT